MKKIRIFFAAMVMLALSATALAQNITVKGTVKDGAGEGIVGASLVLKSNNTVYTMTDAAGAFSLSVPADGVLEVNCMGYEPVLIPVNGHTTLNIVLKDDAQLLEETIVVAFGTSTKEAFTGSATVVKAEKLQKTQTSDVTRAIEGLVPGVQMTTSSGTLGSSPSIIIRGKSSVNHDSVPLVVVDGVPYSGDMNNINPADIESMTVLKDAASNALYGARGADGVIMITTKKAKSGDAIVTLDAKWGWNTKALQNYDYITDPGLYYETYYKAMKDYYMINGMSALDAHAKAASAIDGPSSGGGLGYKIYTYPDDEYVIGSNGKLNPHATLGRKISYKGQEYFVTPDDWLKEVYQQSLRQEYNISASGTTGKASFYASFGYLNNKGIVASNDMQRYTARLRADYQAKEWLKVGANAAYTNFVWHNSNSAEGDSGSTGNIFGMATGIAPVYPLYVRDGNGNIMVDSHGYTVYDYGDGMNAGLLRSYASNSNAQGGAYMDFTESEGNAFNGTAFADITFLKDFKFTFNAGAGLDETRNRDVSNMYYGQFVTDGGRISVSHGRSFYLNLQQLLNYNHTFADRFHLNVMAGHEWYDAKSYSVSASKRGLFSMEDLELNGAIVDGQAASSSQSEYNNEGYFARVQFDDNNTFFLSASFRRDASSRFHPNHRWGNFWSLGAGWLINKEYWFNAPWVNMLKLKASFGSQGNDNIGSYRYVDTYEISNNSGEIAINFVNKGKENISWETNLNFNAGVDFELFDRLSGGVEYFYRKTKDMLYWVSVPASLGYSGYYDNIGDMRNHGFEIDLNFDIIRSKNMLWSVNANATHYTSKILRLPEERKTVNVEGYWGYASGNKFIGEGLPLNTFYIRKFAGIDKTDGLSMWYKDVKDAEGNITGRETTKTYSEATQYLADDPTPKLYGGFGTTFQIGNFDASVQFTYSIGGKTYDSGYALLMASPTTPGYSFHKDVLQAWSADNNTSDIPRFVYQDQYQTSASDRFLVPASYLNIQNAQIGYTLPSKWTRKILVERLRLYVTCDNIWYWSYRKGLDPRYSFSGATNNAHNSPVRTLSGGITVTF